MKCPNCGKEALFVNGKYVCVDCGIEITPEQQALQNQAADPVVASGGQADLPQEEAPEVIKTSEEAEVPAEPVVAPMVPEAPAEPETPVQDYFENALNTEETAEPAQASGVYDFSTPEPASTESNPVTEAPNLDEPIMPEPEAVSVETSAAPAPVEPVSAEEPVVPNAVEPTSYFAPSSFDMSAPAAAVPVEPESVVPELATEPVLPNPDQPVADMPEPIIPPVMPVNEITEPVSAPDLGVEVPQTQSLDDLLGATAVTEPLADASPVSAYGPSMDTVQPGMTQEPTPANVTSEPSMPSVESVFGGTSAQTATTNPNMPTAQDFGIAPPPPAQKKKMWPIVAAAAGAFLLIAGIATVLIINGNRPKTVEPVALTEAEVLSLSNTVTTAMQVPQDISVDYTFGANFSQLTAKEDPKTGELYKDFFSTPYAQNASWSTDIEKNVISESTVALATDKRTYVSEEAATYIYSSKDAKYNKQAGLQLDIIPDIFGVEDKAAVFYTTNVSSASSYGTETIDNVVYQKYQVVPTEEIISTSLESISPLFVGVTYQSLDTTNLMITALTTADGKIKKIIIAGEVSLESDKFSGKVTLAGEANYDYIDVTITNPGAPPGTAPTTDAAPVKEEPQATKNEEGQTSSVGTEAPAPDPLVEAKG